MPKPNPQPKRIRVRDMRLDVAGHMDASESIFFARELEQIRARSYDIQYPEYMARQFVPVDNSINNGVEIVTYETYDRRGRAKMGADYSNDAPRVDIVGSEASTYVRSMRAAYGYSIQEIRAAQYAGKPLQQRKANAAREAIEQEMDDVLTIGWSQGSMKGLANQANTTTYTVPNGALGTATWATKTPDEVVADMHGIAHKIVTDTNGVEVPDTLLLPLTSFTYVASTRMGDGSDQTILRHFMATSPFIKRVEHWFKLESAVNAGLTGAWTGKRMIAYKKSPDKVQAIIPQEFEQFAPQQRGLEFVTECHARTGGVVSYYPKSIAYGDGL